MAAAALTFGEALEVSLVVIVGCSFVGGGARLMVWAVLTPATVLGITSIVLIARFAIRRGQFQPRAPRVIPAATVAWWSR